MTTEIKSKKCIKCKCVLPTDEFYKNKALKDGLYRECITCFKGSRSTFKPSEITIHYDKELLKKEQWKQLSINGELFGYEISTCGRVRVIKTGAILKFSFDCRCYPQLVIYGNGKRISRRLHRLMADNFIPNPYNKSQVNHIDGNKLNTHVSNFEWVSAAENISHAHSTGLHSCHRMVLNTETGVVFNTIKEAGVDYGKTGLSAILKSDKNKTPYRYV